VAQRIQTIWSSSRARPRPWPAPTTSTSHRRYFSSSRRKAYKVPPLGRSFSPPERSECQGGGIFLPCRESIHFLSFQHCCFTLARLTVSVLRKTRRRWASFLSLYVWVDFDGSFRQCRHRTRPLVWARLLGLESHSQIVQGFFRSGERQDIAFLDMQMIVRDQQIPTAVNRNNQYVFR